MRKNFKMQANDNVNISGYVWSADKPKGVVAIIHGLAEHCLRYDEFAEFLNTKNYAVIAIDLRGHGETAKDGVLGHFADKNGDDAVLGDIKMMIQKAKSEFPGVHVALFAHSMGATFGKAAMIKYGELFDVCILSGDTLNKPGLREIAPAFTGLLSLFGKNKPSKLLSNMTFGAYNKACLPARTEFDWLSRSALEVDKYVEDELCGFDGTPALFHDVAKTILFTLKQSNIEKIPKSMKILIISGAKDPCGSDGKDILLLNKKYKTAGLDVEYKLYENARHELLNETNKQEVMEDIAKYLENNIG